MKCLKKSITLTHKLRFWNLLFSQYMFWVSFFKRQRNNCLSCFFLLKSFLVSPGPINFDGNKNKFCQEWEPLIIFRMKHLKKVTLFCRLKRVMIFRDVAQFGSAPVLGTGGRRFESCHPERL